LEISEKTRAGCCCPVVERSFYNVFLQIDILVFIANCCRFAAVESWPVKEYIDSWPVKEHRAYHFET
jgi:hypothetical protein